MDDAVSLLEHRAILSLVNLNCNQWRQTVVRISFLGVAAASPRAYKAISLHREHDNT